MARQIEIVDLVAIMAIVRRWVTEDRLSVSIPARLPHSIIDQTKVTKGRTSSLPARSCA